MASTNFDYGEPMFRESFPLLIGFTLVLIATGCSLDPADPVQADTQAESQQAVSSAPASATDSSRPFLQRNPQKNPNVSTMQVVPPQGRDPLMEQGARFMKLVNEHKKRLEENPRDQEALYFLGNANFDIKRFEKAREYYQKYLELDPNNPGVRTDLASTYFQTKEVDSALLELNRVLEKKPDHPAALFNLGLILDSDEGDRKKAVEVWEKLLENNPDHEHAGEIRRRIEEIRKGS